MHSLRLEQQEAADVAELDSVALRVIRRLQGVLNTSSWWHQIGFTSAKDATAEGNASADLRLHERLRIDYTGHFMRGNLRYIELSRPRSDSRTDQETVRDNVHPTLLPNGKVWSDQILYILQQQATRKR